MSPKQLDSNLPIEIELYKIFYLYEKSGPGSQAYFKRLCDDAIKEHITICEEYSFNEILFENEKDFNAYINKKEAKLTTISDIVSLREYNTQIRNVMEDFSKAVRNCLDVTSLIGFFLDHPFNQKSFNVLGKKLATLPSLKYKPYLDSDYDELPYFLLFYDMPPIESYRDLPALNQTVNGLITENAEYKAIMDKGSARTKYIRNHLLPAFGYIPFEKAEHIFYEAQMAFLEISEKRRTRSSWRGFFGMLASSLIFLFLLPCLFAFSTNIGNNIYYFFTQSYEVAPNFEVTLWGMVLLLPFLFLMSYFGIYQRRRLPLKKLIFQITPRFIFPLCLIISGVCIFCYTGVSDSNNFIIESLFAYGENGYPFAICEIIIAVSILIQDIYSLSNFDSMANWIKVDKPGRSFLTQNGSLYAIPFLMVFRIFLRSMHLPVVICMTILVFLFAFIFPLYLMFLNGDGSDSDWRPFKTFFRAGISTFIYIIIVFFVASFINNGMPQSIGYILGGINYFGIVCIILFITPGVFILLHLFDLIRNGGRCLLPNFSIFALFFVLIFMFFANGSTFPCFEGLDLSSSVKQLKIFSPIFMISMLVVFAFNDLTYIIYTPSYINRNFSATNTSISQIYGPLILMLYLIPGLLFENMNPVDIVFNTFLIPIGSLILSIYVPIRFRRKREERIIWDF